MTRQEQNCIATVDGKPDSAVRSIRSVAMWELVPCMNEAWDLHLTAATPERRAQFAQLYVDCAASLDGIDAGMGY